MPEHNNPYSSSRYNQGYSYHGPTHGEQGAGRADNSFINTAMRTGAQGLFPPIQGFPGSFANNNINSGGSSAAAEEVSSSSAAACQTQGYEYVPHGNVDARLSDGSRGQFYERDGGMSTSLDTSQPRSRNSYPKQMTYLCNPRMPDMDRPAYHNPYEEVLGPASFDQTSRGRMGQEYGPNTQDWIAPYCRSEGANRGPTNMADMSWYGLSMDARLTSHPLPERVNHYESDSGAQFHADPYSRTHAEMTLSLAECPGTSTHANEPLFSSEGPWSTENQRWDVVRKTGTPKILLGMSAHDNTDSTATDDPDTSVTSLYSEFDMNMIASIETLRCNGQSPGGATPQGDLRRTLPAVERSVHTAPSVNIERFTPSLEEDLVSYSRSTYHSRSLSVTQHVPISETSSQASALSSLMSDTIRCKICSTQFTGEYRKGNLSRHIRQKHKELNPQCILCEDKDCYKVFQRTDARLKHYRRHHPRLVLNEIVPRGPRGSRRPNSLQIPAITQQNQEQVLAEVSGWT